MTRLMTASASIAIVQTRWHEDDLIGRLTDPTNPHYTEEEASKWKIINLPALAEDEDPLGREPGELLWPERFDMEFMEAQRRLFLIAAVSQRCTSSAQHQKTAICSTGPIFAFTIRKNCPRICAFTQPDHAVGVDKTRNDATCLLVVGVDDNDDIYLLDCWWEKQQTDKGDGHAGSDEEAQAADLVG